MKSGNHRPSGHGEPFLQARPSPGDRKSPVTATVIRPGRKWLFRLATPAVALVLFFGLLELGLRFAGYASMVGIESTQAHAAVEQLNFADLVDVGSWSATNRRVI